MTTRIARRDPSKIAPHALGSYAIMDIGRKLERIITSRSTKKSPPTASANVP